MRTIWKDSSEIPRIFEKGVLVYRLCTKYSARQARGSRAPLDPPSDPELPHVKARALAFAD